MNSRLTLTIGGVLLVAASVVGCGSGNGSSSSYSGPTSPSPLPPTSSPATAAVTITIGGMNGSNSYSPNPGTIKVGQAVAWRNADTIPHTATADGSAFDTGTIAPGATSSPITLNAVGSFAYHCGFHPSMVGTLNVTQ